MLVIDQHPTSRQVTSDQLAAWGMEVLATDTADSAWHLLLDDTSTELPVDVVVTDQPLARMGDLLELAGTHVVEVTKPVRHRHLAQTVEQLLIESRAAGPVRGLPLATSRPGRGRLLVAEDNEVNQLVAIGMLEQLGYDVDVVKDGLESLAALERTQYDAVLMDCHMPVLDGYAATRAWRQREAGGGRRTPVIALTAGASEGDRERCIAAGMDDYLAKPITPRAVQNALERWVGSSQAHPASSNARTARA